MEKNDAYHTDSEGNSHDTLTEATSRVREDVQRLVDGFDLHAISRNIEEFGRQNPVGLAMTALALGVAVGLLMRGRGSFGTDDR